MTSLGRRLRDLSRFLRYRGRLAPYLRPHRAGFAGAIGLSVLFAAVRLLEPWSLQIVLDQVVLGKPTQLPGGFDPLLWMGGEPQRLLAVAAVGLLALALLAGGLYYAQSVLVARIGQLVVRDLREDVFHHLLRHSLAFHRRNDPGDLLMRLTGDMVFLREMILATIVTMTGELVVLLSTLALMFAISPKLAFVTLAIAPALGLLFGVFRGRMRSAARKQRKREGQIARRIAESLLAVPMIQSFTAEGQEDERFRRACKRSERVGLRAARLEAGMHRSVEILIALGTGLVLWFGIREVLAAQLTPGVFLVFLAYLRGLFKPVRKLAKIAERSARASAAAERVLEVLEAPRDIKDARDAVAAPALRGALRLDGVGFVYEDGTVALENVSAEIRPGEQIAIAGRSGAGKSTLFSLLLGFHRPTHGRIYVDGEKSRHYTLKSLRAQIAYLPQEPFVVAGTVRENLAYGKPDASDAELWAALEVAEIATHVRSLPGGLDAPIASRGQSLSGGQKQRLAIARAVLKDAPILLLDEPTTGLDPETEAVVLRSLERLRAGRTTLVIAHRPETLRSAHRVWILDRGRLVADLAPDAVGDAVSSTHVPGSTGRSQPDAPFGVTGVAGLLMDPEVRGVARLAEPEGRKRFLRELTTVLDRAGEEASLADPGVVQLANADHGVARTANAAAARMCRATGLAEGRGTEVVALKQRLGQRALLRVRTAESTWYVKLFRGRSGDRLAASRAIEMLAGASGITVPRALGWIDRYRALVIEEAEGTPWLELRAEQRLEIAKELGAALARLHARPAPSGWERVEEERPRLERAAARAQATGGAVWAALAADWERAVVHLLDERPAAAGRGDDGGVRRADRGDAGTYLGGGRGLGGGTRCTLVPIHGDVHPDQVRRGLGGALVLLDWDAAGLGEAARDIGNVLAHLELESVRGRLTETEARTLAEAFTDWACQPFRPAPARDAGSETPARDGTSESTSGDARNEPEACGGSACAGSARDVDWHRRATLLRLAALYSDPSFGTCTPNAPTLPVELLRRASLAFRRDPTEVPAALLERVR